MKRALKVLIFLAAVTAPGWARADAFRDAHLAEAITVSSTALSFSSATFVNRSQFSGLGGTDYAFCTVETDAIRFRYDGTNPTASVGHKIASGGSFEIIGYYNVRNFKMIRVTTDASVFCTYERRDERK